MSALLALALAAAAAAAPPAMSTEDRRRALLLTDLLLEDGRTDEAEAFVLDRWSVETDTAPWALRLARVRGAQKRHAEAARLYEELLRTGDDPGILLVYGQHALAAGQTAAARAAFERARRASRGPLAPYYLSELAFAQGRAAEGRGLAREALDKLGSPKDPGQARIRLRLRSRLGWSDDLADEYGRLFDAHPGESDTLSEWAAAMTRAGLRAESAEPIALLRERFPAEERSWRRLEADRLRHGRDPSLGSFLVESVSRLPGDTALRYSLAEWEAGRRLWCPAERDLLLARSSEEQRRAADALLLDVRARGHHHAGPTLRWRESEGTRTLETGLEYRGYPRAGLRLEAEASRGAYRLRSRGVERALAGGAASAALERGPATYGADLDARSGAGATAVSPGLFAGWKDEGSDWGAEARAAFRRARRDSPEAVAAGALAHETELRAQARPWRRLHVGGQARASRVSVRGGGAATQTLLAPEAVLTVLDRPAFVGLGYRVVLLDAKGDDVFFRALPLLRRARTQYAVLSAGRHWLDGRLRTDGYVYNGHEPERGRRFGTDALVGFGLNAQWFVGRLRLTASYENTREDVAGVGGRSQSARLTAHWRWAPSWCQPRESPR